jgi:hypothetical protein
MARQVITHIDEFNLKAKINFSGFQNVLFKNIDFEIELKLDKHINIINFSDCTFKEDVLISTIVENDATFYNCVFEKEIDLQRTTFKGKTRFHNCTFNTTYFLNTRFEELADFWGSIFNEVVIFYKSDFIKTTVFSTATFKENVLFTYTLIEKLLILRGTNFEKGLDLSLAIISGDLGLFDLALKDYESENNLTEQEYETAVSVVGTIPTKNKRETFRILKKYHLDQKNPVEYQDYALQESVVHRKEVFEKLKTKDKWFSSLYDYILLSLNRVSNRHVTSYWRGILFTAIVGVIFFYIALVSTKSYSISFNPSNWSWDSFQESIKYFFISLSPVHKHTYMDELNPETMFYVADFAGRIFVSYGIYQTIQAFRKFR